MSDLFQNLGDDDGLDTASQRVGFVGVQFDHQTVSLDRVFDSPTAVRLRLHDGIEKAAIVRYHGCNRL